MPEIAVMFSKNSFYSSKNLRSTVESELRIDRLTAATTNGNESHP